MTRRGLVVIASFITLLAVAGSVSAHIPIVPVGGTSLDDAVVITDPWKSWFYYSTLEADAPHYYKFNATAGERIRFMVNVPIEEGNRGLAPTFVLMGPGIADQGTPPAFLETPVTGGVMIIDATSLEPEFEGFTPLSQYITTDLNMSAPETGTYYIAVYDDSFSGRYALVTGYVEAYTLDQWIMVPFMAMTILVWSGQQLWMILIPMILPLLLGLLFIIVRHQTTITRNNVPTLLGTSAGLLFLGSGISIFAQMIYALLSAPSNWTIAASLIFGSLPILLGLSLMRLVHRKDWLLSRGRGLAIMLIGVIGLFVWAGLVVGPVIAIATGMIPIARKASG